MIGAGDYIGAEIVKKFASEGFTVFAGRRNGEKLAPLVKEVEDAGGSIVARSLDARKEDEITALLRDADFEAHAVVRDSTGREITDRRVVWTSSDTMVARVTDGGLVTAKSAGSATVTATIDGVSGSATLTVRKR